MKDFELYLKCNDKIYRLESSKMVAKKMGITMNALRCKRYQKKQKNIKDEDLIYIERDTYKLIELK